MADSPLDVEAELDRLYALPLAEFVDARNALSTRLRAAGDKAGAARVKALAKPGAPAWAVNQLRFAAPEIHAALLDAGDRLLSGPADVRAAMQARREAIAAARREAESLLERAGLGTAPATLQRVATTLEALATYGRAPGHPVAGRLSEDLPAPGFEELASLGLLPAAIAGPSPAVVAPAPPPPVAPATPATPPPLRAVPPPEPAELRQARDRAARARDLVAIRKRELDESRARLAAAETEREAATGRRRQLEAELAEAVREEARREEALAAAREARSAAERAVAGATSDAADAEAERARLEALHAEADGRS